MSESLEKIRWVNVVLFFSLALNFFIAGYLASDTKFLGNLHSKHMMHKRPEIRVIDYFPREEKRELWRLMSEQREKLGPVKRGIFESQKEILGIIAAKDVDEERLRLAFRRYQDANDHLQTAINDMVIERVLKMDYETRRRIFQRGTRAHERRKNMQEHWRRHPGGPEAFGERRGPPPEPEYRERP